MPVSTRAFLLGKLSRTSVAGVLRCHETKLPPGGVREPARPQPYQKDADIDGRAEKAQRPLRGLRQSQFGIC